MAEIVLLTSRLTGSAEVLPALALLRHRVHVSPMEPAALLDAPEADVVLLDGVNDLANARSTSRLLRAATTTLPVVLVLGEGGLPVVAADWGADDLVLESASPAEVDARLRLAIERARSTDDGGQPDEISTGELVIDPVAYTARLRGKALDLTYKEFELLRHLAQHPGRVFTRAQLLHEVWGYDYFGGTRTVDVHIRRLRAKLGPEHDKQISTVRNVGYRFDAPAERRGAESDERRLHGDDRVSSEDADAAVAGQPAGTPTGDAR